MSIGILDLSSMFHRLWHVDRANVEHKIITFLRTMKETDVIVAARLKGIIPDVEKVEKIKQS